MKSNSEQKRLRIFAGPNGSGKSTLAKNMIESTDSRIKLGKFINADEIEKSFNELGFCSLNKYFDFNVETDEIQGFVKLKGMSPLKLKSPEIYKNFTIKNNCIYYSGVINSYIAADIAAYLRIKLIDKGMSFSFETVFSHESKIEIIKKAKDNGYRVYLYFVTTQDVDINVNRVEIRVRKGGHDVPKTSIINRYNRSLDIISKAMPLCYRTFLFDNSRVMNFILEVDNNFQILPSISVKEELVTVPVWIHSLIKKVSL